MKKVLLSILAVAFSGIATVSARSLDVKCGNVTYRYSDTEMGVATFANGTDINIAGHTFPIATISKISVSEQDIADNTVCVVFAEAGAEVVVAGNIADYITATVYNGDVVIDQSSLVADNTCGEITYVLSGNSSDGSFTLNGEYKASIELKGVNLTSKTGAPLNIQNGKRINLRIVEGTVNNLEDAQNGTQKGCIVCKGHLEFKQKGTLNVTGNTAHAIYSKEYISIKNSKINISGAVKDGVNCNQHFTMDSGSLVIDNVGDDGVQVSFKDDADRDEEDTGDITINGGSIQIAVTANACKAFKADHDFIMGGGEITALVAGGGVWDSVALKTKAAACVSTNGQVMINGGSLDLKATGGGGKGISSDGDFIFNDGTLMISTTGKMCVYQNNAINNNFTSNADRIASANKSSAKGIKCDNNAYINGGFITITTTGTNAEGIEAKNTLTFNGGKVSIKAYDDGTNSAYDTYINGGELDIQSVVGDGIDSNRSIIVSGGNIRVFGAGGSEQGFDAGTESGGKVTFTGGVMLAVGGGNSAPTTSDSESIAYITGSLSVKAGQTITISQGATQIASFEVPQNYTGSGSTILIGSPLLNSGSSYTVSNGSNSITQTAKLTGGSSGPGGGGPGGNRPGWGF